ncbi:MAG TPA: hypothetical protein VGD26_09565 [Chitinophagaceae bacterium]
MIDFTIKVENKFVGDAVVLFFDNYKESIATFLNNVLKGETGSADAFISKTAEGQLEVYQFAPDKGKVLAQVDGSVIFTDYKSLALDSKYVVYNGQHLALFLKRPDGESDIQVGRFANLNDVETQIDSESVRDAINHVLTGIKNAEVERKKIEKQARKLKKMVRVND